jgi:phospholipid/cholesterol/gamma-HCH transport system substrate-binding protein
MQKQAPTRGKLGVMVFFALSCFLLLLYLWKSFGGPTPLAPQGYRFVANFDEATQLADNADVRISGVTVGHVVRSELVGDRTRATIQIASRYAPIPRNTQAILRQKTLLGETYVEMTPGDPRLGMLRDEGTLAAGRVRPTTELDEVLRALDPGTRRDFKRFLIGTAAALRGRGESLNDALGNAAPFAHDANDLLRILDSQHRAVRGLVRDSGTVFEALGRQQGQLSGLVEASDRVLSTTARRDAELAETIHILPTTLRELRPTFEQLAAVSRDARPLIHDLRPAGRALAPALRDTIQLAPKLRQLFLKLDPVIAISKTALPATTRVVNAAHPLFRLLVPVLLEALPIVDFAYLYKAELVTAFADIATSTEASEVGVAGGPRIHYLRALVPFTQEGLVAWPKRISSNRHDPYLLPRELQRLKTHLRSFDCRNTGNPGSQAAPPCTERPGLHFRGRSTLYPHIRKDPR